MPALLLFLVKLSCALGLIWLFYRLVLHSLTFYSLNRWYLLGYTVLSFLMPLVHIGPIRGEDPALQPVIIQYIPVIGAPVQLVATTAAHTPDRWNYVLLVLALGSCFLLARFAFRCYSLRHMRREALLVKDGPIRIFHVGHPIAPFSFGNAIYINPDRHDENEWEEIILHEYVHIRQRHTVDILFGEFLLLVNWYNPFAWLIRYSIRQNLEFIADRAVVETGHDKKGYQYHLLKVLGQNRYKLANNFNFSSLKKRIIMMNKMKSTRLNLLRFLFILPLLTVLLVAFRDRFPVHPVSTSLRQPGARQLSPQQPSLQAAAIRPSGPASNIPSTVVIPARPRPETRLTRPVATDTVPRKPGTIAKPLDYTKVLWIVDGEPKPRGWNGKDSLKTEDLASMSIYKGEDAKRLFGDGAEDGVIAVTTKKNQVAMAKLSIVGRGAPLMVVDGSPKENGVGDLNPDSIESITVLKPEAAKAIYGDKGANGVVLIRTKKDAHPHIVAELKDSSGKPFTVIADTMTTAQGKFYPQK